MHVSLQPEVGSAALVELDELAVEHESNRSLATWDCRGRKPYSVIMAAQLRFPAWVVPPPHAVEECSRVVDRRIC